MSLSRTEVEVELQNLSPADLMRIKTMARTYSSGLAFMTHEDIRQEAFTKLLSGERVFPRNARPVIVVINAMHSEASNCREREQQGAVDHHVDVSAMSQPMDDDAVTTVVIPMNELTPERMLQGRQDMAAIEALVADDADLQDVVAIWSLGLRGKDASEYLGWEMNRYESARKRLMRRLGSIKEEDKK